MPDVLVFAALVPKLLGAKIVLDLHDPMPELMMTIFNAQPDSRTVTWMTRLERWSIAFSDVVITVNRACEKLFTARGARREKVRVVMNSPDENIFEFKPAQHRNAEPADEGRPFVIMYHGTLVERNGLDLAVEAVSRLKETLPRVQMRIYGARTPYLEQVMATVADRGLQDDVLYLGARRLEQLSEAIAECDVGVIPNKRSIFTEINTPTRIFEYLALGKAVVAPRAPGIEDYFDEDSLVYFDLGDAAQLTEALASVATHPDDALRVTQRGQAVYLEHSWSKEKARLLATVADLMTSGRKRL
jgi:glycosyltransferase involved in cell wall biosynthesis